MSRGNEKDKMVSLAMEFIRQNGPSSVKEIARWANEGRKIRNGVSVRTLSNLLSGSGTFVKRGRVRFALSGEVSLWDVVEA
jgi:hypothetical protein